jgi:tetratricopeptide (TPR) repeat protein
MPAVPDRNTYLQGIAALEAAGQLKAALRGYQAALQKWSADPVAMLGTGNVYYALGQLDEANAVYRKLLNVEPDHTIALNNLAQVLADRGCHKAALATVDTALADMNLNSGVKSAVMRTRADIVRGLSLGNSTSIKCAATFLQ